MRRLAVLTSGGDAPGMNAAIRAVTRAAIAQGVEVVGIRRGYEGLLEGDIIPMSISSVGGIIHRGGTILRTARCERFLRPEGVNEGLDQLRAFDIDALVVVGGDGSFRGAWELDQRGFPVAGVPGTIDNDVAGTDATIGFDTAANTALEAVVRLRDTAS
ncbi:MAG TPA: 6-phosphofructokinase, partial [Synergistaceae bacterium]|nr:6-phosphofructokinase [Synergistaceae bacterium]